VKTRIAVAISLLGLSLFPTGGVGAATLDEYGPLFHAVLNNMMDNYAWQEDPQGDPVAGNWDQDQLSAATLFAPYLLYRLAHDPDYGAPADRARALTLAEETAGYEMGLLTGYLRWSEGKFDIDSVPVSRGDFLYFTVTPNGPNGCDSTAFEVTIQQGVATWNLASDLRLFPDQANPNPDGHGNGEVWHLMQSATNDRDPSTYTLLADFITDAFLIQGLQQWQGAEGSPPHDGLPAVGLNATGSVQEIGDGFSWGPGVVRVHPALGNNVVVGWQSPIDGQVRVRGSFALMHDFSCGNGIRWFVDSEAGALAQGTLPWGSDAPIETFAGAPCLIDALKFTGDPGYGDTARAAIFAARDILARHPNPFGDSVGYVGAYGLFAYAAFYFADVQKNLFGLMAQDAFLRLMNEAIRSYWDASAGVFRPVYSLYEDGYMLMGLAYAYGATGNETYRSMADAVMAHHDALLWDDGYWEYDGARKSLSAHESLARAALHWFEVTGDASYLDQARKMLSYAEEHLCAEDLDHPGETICYNDWTPGGGLSESRCTGRNFSLLDDIYLLNMFVQESGNYPRPIGVGCGRLVSGSAPASAQASAGTVLLALPAGFVLVLKRARRRRASSRRPFPPLGAR